MMRMIVLGSGGHAAHIISVVAAAGRAVVVGCYDDDPRRVGGEVMGVRVLGTITALSAILPDSADAVALAIGDPRIRERLLQRAREHGWRCPAIIHPQAAIGAGVVIWEGCVIDAGVVIGARATIGAGAIIEAGVSIAHDAAVAEMTHIEAGVRILPAARIGRCARIGAGAVVLRQVVVDEGTVITPLTVVGPTASSSGA